MFNLQTPPKDAPLYDTMDLGDNVLYIERKDPHGLLHLRLSQGTLPEKYQGLYTDKKSAELDALKYKTERQKAKEELAEDVKSKRVRSRAELH